MAVMNGLNQHLLRCVNGWHYVRRVPSEYADFDPRGMIRKSLKAESLEVARARRDALAEADELFRIAESGVFLLTLVRKAGRNFNEISELGRNAAHIGVGYYCRSDKRC